MREQSVRLRAAAFHFDDAIDLAMRPMSKCPMKIADLFTKLQSLFEDAPRRRSSSCCDETSVMYHSYANPGGFPCNFVL
jgi:hypothetical protein